MTTYHSISAAHSLEGECVRGDALAPVSLDLVARAGPSAWRAVQTGGAALAAGDQVRFGDQSNRVCFLGTLAATVTAVVADGGLVLTFPYTDTVLDEMLAALQA
jgi:S-adenosylmethionine:tRNA ribosyltransferase-isomerase